MKMGGPKTESAKAIFAFSLKSIPAVLEQNALRVFYDLRDSFRVILRLQGDGSVPISSTAIEYFPYDIRHVVASDGVACGMSLHISGARVAFRSSARK